jgi:thiamine biosynthesis protein ThiS
MKIVLNNKEEILQTTKTSLTIAELLLLKNYSFRSLVIKINGDLVKREKRETASFKEGDRVEVIHLISGG